MKTEYALVHFWPTHRVGNLGLVSGIAADGGKTLTRFTDDGRDDLHITMPGQPETVIPWTRVASAILPEPPAKPEKLAK